MLEPIRDKIAAVTGGTRGIGRAIAERLAAEGVRVAICGRTEESARRAAAAMPGTLAVGADLSTLEDVRKFFHAIDERFGGLDILVNNAGIGIFGSLAELSPEDWLRTIGLNLNGAFFCAQEALRRFRNRGGGYVVNISSLAGKNPFAGGAAYNASKFALNGMSEAMMLDHRYENVRVSYIMPGSVATGFGSGGEADWKIAPEDIAETVVLLLRMPSRTTVSRVEIRPSKPRKQ
ncbi:MAG: SDR family oxidoreductase [Bryobacteraceae bacterium]